MPSWELLQKSPPGGLLETFKEFVMETIKSQVKETLERIILEERKNFVKRGVMLEMAIF